MLHVYLGTDRQKVRRAMWKVAEAAAKSAGAEVDRITEGETVRHDVERSLAGGGLFAARRVVILDELAATDAREFLLEALPRLSASGETFFLFEEKPDAETKKLLKKYATEEPVVYDVPKQLRDNSAFQVAESFVRRDKKQVWVAYVRALQKGNAPEAIHGALFWKVKTLLFRTPASHDLRKMIAELASLPHEARRAGIELEYALEHYLLTYMKTVSTRAYLNGQRGGLPYRNENYSR